MNQDKADIFSTTLIDSMPFSCFCARRKRTTIDKPSPHLNPSDLASIQEWSDGALDNTPIKRGPIQVGGITFITPQSTNVDGSDCSSDPVFHPSAAAAEVAYPETTLTEVIEIEPVLVTWSSMPELVNEWNGPPSDHIDNGILSAIPEIITDNEVICEESANSLDGADFLRGARLQADHDGIHHALSFAPEDHNRKSGTTDKSVETFPEESAFEARTEAVNRNGVLEQVVSRTTSEPVPEYSIFDARIEAVDELVGEVEQICEENLQLGEVSTPELEYIDEYGIPPEEQYNSATNVSFFNPCSATLGYPTARLLQYRLSGIVSRKPHT